MGKYISLYLSLSNHHMKAPQSWGMWRSPRLAAGEGINIWWHDGSMNISAACDGGAGPGSCVRAAGYFGGPLYALLQVCTTQTHCNTSHKQIQCHRQEWFSGFLFKYACFTYYRLHKDVYFNAFLHEIRSNCQHSSLLKKDMLSKQPFRQIRYLQISNDVARNMDIDITHLVWLR